MSYDCCDGHSLCEKCQKIKDDENARWQDGHRRRVKPGQPGEGLAAMMLRLLPPTHPPK